MVNKVWFRSVFITHFSWYFLSFFGTNTRTWFISVLLDKPQINTPERTLNSASMRMLPCKDGTAQFLFFSCGCWCCLAIGSSFCLHWRDYPPLFQDDGCSSVASKGVGRRNTSIASSTAAQWTLSQGAGDSLLFCVPQCHLKGLWHIFKAKEQ